MRQQKLTASQAPKAVDVHIDRHLRVSMSTSTTLPQGLAADGHQDPREVLAADGRRGQFWYWEADPGAK